MKERDWMKYLLREHKDFYSELLAQLRNCTQKGIRVDTDGHYETNKIKIRCEANVNDGSWLIFHPRRKGGQRIHINNMKQDYRKCIRSYASFLRADGIETAEEIKFYILHYTFWHISFNRRITITYKDTEPLIDEVVKWIMRKEIEAVDKSKFIDPRKIAAPKEIFDKNGGFYEARKSEKIRLTKQAQKILTDKDIAEKYNPDLTNEENAAIIGVGLTRLKQWKRENADKLESVEDKIKRLYNPLASWKKNAEIIGHSVNTIKKYIKKEEPINNISQIILSVEEEAEQSSLLTLDYDGLLRSMFGDEFMEELDAML